MADAIERSLEAAIATGSCYLGQIAIGKSNRQSFELSHRDDKGREDLHSFKNAEAAIEIAKFDDAANYRPLKTAPSLRHGWRLELPNLETVRRALDYFYPGRLAAFTAWKSKQLRTTPLRETLQRQSGIYRIAAKISETQANELVGNFCRSDGGCLRTILWQRDSAGTAPSTLLPSEKFDPAHDQTGQGERALPLLCQEACNLLVAECRKVAKTESAAPSAPE